MDEPAQGGRVDTRTGPSRPGPSASCWSAFPPGLAARITAELKIPTIGIGAVNRCPPLRYRCPASLAGPAANFQQPVLGAEAADRITQQGSTLERSSRDGAPSRLRLSFRMPGCRPNPPPRLAVPLRSRLEAVSTVPVEKSDTSRAPLGPTIASSGNQDYGRGSTLFPSRRGAIGGRGKAQPSIEGDSREDPSELCAGIRVQRLMKLSQGHPNVLDYILNGDLCLIVNTPSGKVDGRGPLLLDDFAVLDQLGGGLRGPCPIP